MRAGSSITAKAVASVYGRFQVTAACFVPTDRSDARRCKLVRPARRPSERLGVGSFTPRVSRALHFRHLFETEPFAPATALNPPQRFSRTQARISLTDPDKLSIIYANERGPGGDINHAPRKDAPWAGRRALHNALHKPEIL